MTSISTATAGVGAAHPGFGMRRPRPRGPFGEGLLAVLGDVPGSPGAESRAGELPEAARAAVSRSGDLLSDEDVQLGLFVLHALLHQGIEGVADRWETHPELVRVRGVLSDAIEAQLRAAVPTDPVPGSPQEVADALFGIAADDDGPGLARHLSGRATAGQAREYLQLKSVYQLIEGDPHTWAIPRLGGRAKAGLLEIQVDEYGGGSAHRMHAALFAAAMREAGLDDTWGNAADRVPALWLAGVNIPTMFALQRRLRGAAVGHLAMYEITSSVPSRFLARGFRRLGLPAAAAFYDEHVEADAAHEQIAARDMAGRLVVEDPAVAADVFFGARCVLHADALAAGRTLDRWAAGGSALRPESPGGTRSAAAEPVP